MINSSLLLWLMFQLLTICYRLQPMFNATLTSRADSFRQAPGTAMFVHWLIGMVYVFYFASFILLLREIFRPGVLWFLRNVNDPEFNPIHEVRDRYKLCTSYIRLSQPLLMLVTKDSTALMQSTCACSGVDCAAGLEKR